MNEKRIARLDRASALLLLLWAGAVLGIAALAVSIVFHRSLSGDMAGQVAETCFVWADRLALGAFGLAFLLSCGARWFWEIRETGIGPLRLWSAAALAALLMCFTSAAIVNPRMAAIRAGAQGAVASLSAGSPEQRAYQRARSLAYQLLGLRLLLALGLTAGLARLPKGGAAASEAKAED